MSQPIGLCIASIKIYIRGRDVLPLGSRRTLLRLGKLAFRGPLY
jgi:hypothetical protein